MRLREPMLLRNVSLDIGTHVFSPLTLWNPGILRAEVWRDADGNGNADETGAFGRPPDAAAMYMSQDGLISRPCLNLATVL